MGSQHGCAFRSYSEFRKESELGVKLPRRNEVVKQFDLSLINVETAGWREYADISAARSTFLVTNHLLVTTDVRIAAKVDVYESTSILNESDVSANTRVQVEDIYAELPYLRGEYPMVAQAGVERVIVSIKR